MNHDLNKEIWLPIFEYEGFYSISNHGRVRSETRLVMASRGKSKYRSSPGRAIKTPTNKSGYEHFRMSRFGKIKDAFVHIEVANSFLGLGGDNLIVLHFDDNKTNNNVENLRWGTHSDNRQDALRNGRDWHAAKTHCPSGHPYDSENTYINPSSGGRMCRICIKGRTKNRLQVRDE